jgi:hypothetical protein
LALSASDHAEATKYFAKNRVENFDVATTISLSDTKSGLKFWATPICEWILLFSHSLGR